MAVLFDTNILIEFLRGREQARDLLSAQTDPPSVSVASVVELYAGYRSRREELEGERLLQQSSMLALTPDIAKRAGVFSRLYERSHGIDDMDAIVAATAEHHGLRLATLNVKHFPMFPRLKRAY
jgi:predicted nucleic acid-binding protein